MIATSMWSKDLLLDAMNKPEIGVAIILEIPGDPKPFVEGKKGLFGWYDPRRNYKEQVRWYIRKQYSHKLIRSPVIVGFTFEMPIPKSWPKWKKEQARTGELLHQTKPDCDNLIKLYLDCLKKIVIWDDAQVVKFDPPPEKKYSDDPKTIIWVREA